MAYLQKVRQTHKSSKKAAALLFYPKHFDYLHLCQYHLISHKIQKKILIISIRKILKWHPPCPKKGLPWCKHHWSLLWAVDSHPIIAKRICASIPPPVCAPIAMTWSQLSHKTCNIDCMEEWQPKDVKGWNLSSTQIFCRELLTYILYKYLTLHHSKISNPTPQFSRDLEIPPLSCAPSPQPYLQKEAGGRRSEVKWYLRTACDCVYVAWHTRNHTCGTHSICWLFTNPSSWKLFFIILRGKLHFLHRLLPDKSEIFKKS